MAERADAGRRILYLQYTNPAGYPPLEHSSRILAERGWSVRFLGTGALGADALRFPPHPRIDVRQVPFQAAGWRQKLHYLRYCAWALAAARRWRPAWIYASDPLACLPALLAGRASGGRLLYHEHDSPAEGLPQRGVARMLAAARHRLARRADLIVLPNQTRLDYFLAATGASPARAHCVWNCPAQEEIGPPRPDIPVAPLRVLYHGSLVPARLPPSVIDALARLNGKASLTVIGYETVGHPDYTRDLYARAEQHGVHEHLILIGTVPTRSELHAHGRRANVGIALLPTDTTNLNERTMFSGASNKVFDYLAAGLAVLVPDQAEWRALYVRPGYGLACNPADPSSIAAALADMLADPAEVRAMGERGRQRILDEWHYERQFAPVLAALEGPML